MAVDLDIGNQIKREELTKTFMIFKLKKPLLQQNFKQK